MCTSFTFISSMFKTNQCILNGLFCEETDIAYMELSQVYPIVHQFYFTVHLVCPMMHLVYPIVHLVYPIVHLVYPIVHLVFFDDAPSPSWCTWSIP